MAAINVKNTVKITNFSDVNAEYEALEAIIPGMLLKQVSGLETIEIHDVQGGNVIPMFAVENELEGEGVDDDFAAGDKIQVWIPGRGDIVNALLRDEETITIGEFLMSDGEGRLMSLAITAGESGEAEAIRPIVGVAVENVDLSTLPEGSESSAGGTYHNPRIMVRII